MKYADLPKRIARKVFKTICPFRPQPEKDFAKRVQIGETVDLPEFTYVRPNSHITRYKNIEVEQDFKKLSQTLYLEKTILLSVREMWNIYNWVKRTSNIAGDIAELGVFKGGSAKLIGETEKAKTIYLFDTFEGLPATNASFDSTLKQGELCGDNEAGVRDYLNDYKNTKTVKGVFPESAGPVKEKRFSFVHLDADIYQSTLDALRFFYPRLSPGGVIITHDYRCIATPGVKKAFDQFFKDKQETIIELWDTQAMIIKNTHDIKR